MFVALPPWAAQPQVLGPDISGVLLSRVHLDIKVTKQNSRFIGGLPLLTMLDGCDMLGLFLPEGSAFVQLPLGASLSPRRPPEEPKSHLSEMPEPSGRPFSVLRLLLSTLVMGPCWILVGSVLWAPILCIVHNWYVLGSRLTAHRKTIGSVGCPNSHRRSESLTGALSLESFTGPILPQPKATQEVILRHKHAASEVWNQNAVDLRKGSS